MDVLDDFLTLFYAGLHRHGIAIGAAYDPIDHGGLRRGWVHEASLGAN